jgi:alcohol dehydrogenase class IV
VGLCYDLPHGVVCAVLMPPVLERNRKAEPAKYEALRDALDGDPVAVLRAMNEQFGLPSTLGPPPDPEWEQTILDYALPSGSSAANPVPVTASFVRGILSDVCN